jgi:hypothetical protein
MKSDFVSPKGPKINFATELAKKDMWKPGVGSYGKVENLVKKTGKKLNAIDKALFTLTTKGAHRGWK